jgi:hypothetical protein
MCVRVFICCFVLTCTVEACDGHVSLPVGLTKRLEGTYVLNSESVEARWPNSFQLKKKKKKAI